MNEPKEPGLLWIIAACSWFARQRHWPIVGRSLNRRFRASTSRSWKLINVSREKERRRTKKETELPTTCIFFRFSCWKELDDTAEIAASSKAPFLAVKGAWNWPRLKPGLGRKRERPIASRLICLKYAFRAKLGEGEAVLGSWLPYAAAFGERAFTFTLKMAVEPGLTLPEYRVTCIRAAFAKAIPMSPWLFRRGVSAYRYLLRNDSRRS